MWRNSAPPSPPDRHKPIPGSSALLFSGQIVSGEADYGPIGVVTVLVSYLIGLAVCLHLGAVAGRMWNERGSQP
jgi:hypothetical protein